MRDMPATPWQEVVRQIVKSRDDLSMGDVDAMVHIRKVPGASSGTYRQAMSRQRAPNVELFELLADILGVEPETFVEYRLLLARRSLDPDAVGLDAALEQLEALEAATRSAARAPARRAAARQSSSRPQKRADRPARGSAREA